MLEIKAFVVVGFGGMWKRNSMDQKGTSQYYFRLLKEDVGRIVFSKGNQGKIRGSGDCVV